MASGRELDREALKRAAVELRKKGLPWTRIGRQLKISNATAKRLVDEALRELAEDRLTSTLELRELTMLRLNEGRQQVFELMLPHNPPDIRLKAAAEWRALNDQEAKLLGLNSPDLFSLSLPLPLLEQLERMGLKPADLVGELNRIMAPVPVAPSLPLGDADDE